MTTVSLLYHDVIENGAYDSSGFTGADANIYKLDYELFVRHLDSVLNVNSQVTFTVDDGGASSFTTIAPLLEQRGLRGQFFIATNWIDAPGFMTGEEIRELRQRGHVIGTHSCSHPPRISHCSWEEVQEEWKRSAEFLEKIVGEPIRMGSVPGGYYSRRVARAAEMAGLRTLFTSEPTVRISHVGNCVVVGRFMIQRSTTPKTAADLARGNSIACHKQALAWNTKKCVKAVGGPFWLRFRKWALEH